MPARHTSGASLLGLRIRGRRRGGTVIGGILRRRGRLVCAIRGAAADEGKGDDSETGSDGVFHGGNME